jgi:ligand-binding sensor domain-containing protein
MLRSGRVKIGIVSCLVLNFCLWVSSIGLCRGETGHITIDLGSDKVNTIAVDQNCLWFGTLCGIRKYDLLTNQKSDYTTAQGYVHANVVDIAVEKDNVWFLSMANKSLISRYNKTSMKWTSFIPEYGKDAIGPKLIDSTSEDGEDTFTWFGCPETLEDLDVGILDADDTSLWIVPGRYNLISFDKKNHIWREVKSYYKTYRERSKESMSCNNFAGIASDANTLWCYEETWTQRAGLLKYDKLTGQWKSYKKEVGGNINALSVGKDNVWIASPGGGRAGILVGIFNVITGKGITRFNKKQDRWETFSKRHGLPSGKVISIKTDGEHTWALTLGGICRFNSSRNRWESLSILIEKKPKLLRKVQSAFQDFVKSVWHGDNREKFVFEVENDVVYFGGMQSILYKLDINTLDFNIYHLQFEKSLSKNSIAALARDDENVYVVTVDGVLSVYDKKTGEWTLHDGKLGWVARIYPGKDRIWFASKLGWKGDVRIASFDKQRKQIRVRSGRASI